MQHRVGALSLDVPLTLHSIVDFHMCEIACISRVQLYFTNAMCKTLDKSIEFCTRLDRLESSLIHGLLQDGLTLEHVIQLLRFAV